MRYWTTDTGERITEETMWRMWLDAMRKNISHAEAMDWGLTVADAYEMYAQTEADAAGWTETRED